MTFRSTRDPGKNSYILPVFVRGFRISQLQQPQGGACPADILPTMPTAGEGEIPPPPTPLEFFWLV